MVFVGVEVYQVPVGVGVMVKVLVEVVVQVKVAVGLAVPVPIVMTELARGKPLKATAPGTFRVVMAPEATVAWKVPLSAEAERS